MIDKEIVHKLAEVEKNENRKIKSYGEWSMKENIDNGGKEALEVIRLEIFHKYQSSKLQEAK